MDVITDIREMQERSDTNRADGKRVVLVPTMGFFHEGHLSLMHAGRKMGDDLVVSLFVNPTQFGPNEDFEDYPRDFERDAAMAESAGVDVLFHPSVKAFYPSGYQTYITLSDLPAHLCGLSRPIHFKGVATVVAKLFNAVKPHTAVFGRKDFQQVQVIRRLVADLNFDVAVEDCPIYREPDGLAMSSRNTYLTPAQRPAALSLSAALKSAVAAVAAGERDAAALARAARESIGKHPETDIDYISVCDPGTLDNVETVEGPTLMALAVKVGRTRLIDNTVLTPGDTAA